MMSKTEPKKLDHKYLWHPFTQMRDWLKKEPIVLTKGKVGRSYNIGGENQHTNT